MPSPSYSRTLCWFRRDLRNHDHAALYHALKQSRQVYCVFVFDRDILDALPSRLDRRVEFIWHSVAELRQALRTDGGELIVLHDRAVDAVPRLARALGVEAVFSNRDYEPAAIARDAAVEASLRAQGVAFPQYKDQVIFERDEVLTQAGKPFSVFTPYRNAWLKRLTPFHVTAYPVERYLGSLALHEAEPMPTLAELGFAPTNLDELGIRCGMSGSAALLDDFLARVDRYHEARDYPAVKGVSYLSVHLRFGTVSIRQLVRTAWDGSQPGAGPGHACWLSELIWRDFYQQILWHFPRVAGHAFKPAYEHIAFPNDPARFAAWREGRTGFPIVDAAMRQLAHSGYMHNRLRMIAASFLMKDLHIDWRWGERHFAEQLIDFDLAANNGGWQWAASTGCDAQPYFRIFNPVVQSEKFDPQGRFIRRYVPELARCPERYLHAPWTMPLPTQQQCGIVIGRDYPAPLVDHAQAREIALTLYGKD